MTEEATKPKRAARAPATPLPPPDPLDAFVTLANGDARQALMLMFWKQRLENPGFSIQVAPADLTGFAACVDYLEVTPRIQIVRPQGLPAQDPIPAQGNRRAVPGRAAQPPRNYVVIQMVDERGDAFVPIENNEEDHVRSLKAKEAKRLRDAAPQLAAQLQADMNQNLYSNETIQRAVATLKLLGAAAA